MKKTLLAFTLASMFMASAVQAVDHSATVDISGTITGNADSGCNVYISTPTVNLSSKIDSLPNQGDKATAPVPLDYSVTGTNMNTSVCLDTVALLFHGEIDGTDGYALANDNTGAGAAQGVGVGVFDKDLNPIIINGNKITLDSNQPLAVAYLQMVKLNGETPVEGTVHASMTIDIMRL
ncbi:fimbrial protein [Lelliottia amnigena]|jgi:major type 1 subunit fimbrin (pilin)